MKTILTDIDGVVLDWETAFHTWMDHKEHGSVVNQNLYDVGHTYGIARTEAKARVETFNSSAAIGFLPPLRDSQWWIRRLHEQHGYNFVAVTSLSDDPHAQELRIKNLRKLYGNAFTDFHILGCGEDKDLVLEELSREYWNCFWIEDKPENYDVGERFGFRSILMEHGHNMLWGYDTKAEVAKNWEDVYNKVIQREEIDRAISSCTVKSI